MAWVLSGHARDLVLYANEQFRTPDWRMWSSPSWFRFREEWRVTATKRHASANEHDGTARMFYLNAERSGAFHLEANKAPVRWMVLRVK
jgi:hypothetical protein